MLCVSIAHWKAVLPASRQHSLQIASKQATQPADCLQAGNTACRLPASMWSYDGSTLPAAGIL